jgi:hypothetical protein
MRSTSLWAESVTAPAHSDHGRLAAITCHFNPCGYRRPRENYLRFRELLQGCPLFAVEIQFDPADPLPTAGTIDRPSAVPAEWQIVASPRQCLWQKEAALNWIVPQLPPQFEYVAWIDADLQFLNAEWPRETVAALQRFPVVQLFEQVHYLNPQGRLTHTIPSWASVQRKQLRCHGAPGGAWAAHRSLLEQHRLYDRNVVGGGDSQFTDALIGQWNGYLTTVSPPAMNDDFRSWGKPLWRSVLGQFGLVSGDVVHWYHGSRENRRYAQRTSILTDFDFDPTRDLRLADNGLLEWTCEKPGLISAVTRYFHQRLEDDVPAE